MPRDLEYRLVELPLIEQLKSMGWKHLEGAHPTAVYPTDPRASGRQSFNDVALFPRLKAALRRINLDVNGSEWLDDSRIDTAVGALTRIATSSLLEANQITTELLINGIDVEGKFSWNQGRAQRVHFIDWEHLENNDLVVVNQFRVNIPGAQHFIVPDVVLFVNGIPLVVIECKKTTTKSLVSAANQIRRYAGEARSGTYREGNKQFFHTIQLTAVTNGEEAKLGTFTASAKHYVPWRDPYPLTEAELAESLGKRPDSLSRQEILAAGVFEPSRLLNILHNFTTFLTLDTGQTVKIAPRYQQFRAVERAILRLQNGKTAREDGKDRRGGIIWHTQGSGKSLTMSFLVRRLRTLPDLAAMKVVVVTDRTQLEDQLGETMGLTGETVVAAKSARRARTLLSRRGPGVVLAMIQKQQDDGSGERGGISAGEDLGEINTDESIVVLIDEVHRSQASKLGMRLAAALPNAARIGFTGTPIMTRKGQRKTSVEIFGPFIDAYRMRDAEADGVIVPILYEAFQVKGAVRDGQELNELFLEQFADLDSDEQQELQQRWATRRDVSAAQQLVDVKAKHMLGHYVDKVLEEGFKAQVVAEDRRMVLRYRDAFQDARTELLRAAQRLPGAIAVRPRKELSARQLRLVKARDNADLLRRIDFVPVISEGTADDEHRYLEWTNPTKRKRRIDGFTKPFGENDIGFVIVQSMLLTGFDAPIEQVMYLDRRLTEHSLLQAVARVNRNAEGKEYGWVVDYTGVAQNLLEALRLYAAEDFDPSEGADVADAMRDSAVEVAALEPQRQRVRMMFARPDDIESCVAELADSELRDRFEAEYFRFARTVNAVMPDPAAQPYIGDVEHFAVVKLTANRRYRVDDGEFDPAEWGAQVRELIDEHITSLGIEQQLPPVALTAPDFAAKVEAMSGGTRAKASEMEHAIRHHITIHQGRNPRRYRMLSERLEQILNDWEQDWEAQIAAMRHLIDEEREYPDLDENPHGLNDVQSSLYGVLMEHFATSADDAADVVYAQIAIRVCDMASQTIHRRDFWNKTPDQEQFKSKIFNYLVEAGLGNAEALTSAASQLVDVVRENRNAIPRPGDAP